ncbi:serine protease [Methylobacterium currus]|uniref:S1 family peptidase n=1 Tax=Methylobacterium currus TaxID=2051553 RepID=UPI001E2BD9CD|nr:serine protease [Methylobacterium currus]UHC17825.1 serine protease [Methylobacterium currus]
MTGTQRFVASRTLAGLDLVRIDDRPVLEDHERLRGLLGRYGGAALAALFAEPVVSRSNGAAPARVDWYTGLDGPIRPLAELTSGEARRVQERLRAALAALEPLLGGPDGPLPAASLNLASPQAVMAVGEAPLLIDWGLLPRGLAADENGRLRHAAATLGPDWPVPPVGREDWAARFARPATPEPEVASPPLPHGPPRRTFTRVPTPIPAPVAACAIAALLVGLSYIPGVLAFPRPPEAVPPEAGALRTAWLEGLRQRHAALAAADGLDCPRLRTALPGLVPQSPAGVRLPADAAAPPQARAAVEAPAGPVVPGSPAAPAPDGLVDRLERSTVLVIAGDATGSGFFVAEDLVVTNRHVIESAIAGATEVRIAGRHAGIVPATLVRAGEPGTLTDFALLRVARGTGGRPLALAPPGRPLTPVVGSGFPGLYLGTDPTFARLREGDTTASRDLVPVLQTGVVNHLQRYDEAAVTLVLHGAEIAPGNSGGPLVDYCGRVVGVNTFGRTDDRLPVTARYALGADGLAAFLAASGVAAALDSRACDLQAAPRPTVAAAEVEPAAPAPARSAPRSGRDARPAAPAPAR